MSIASSFWEKGVKSTVESVNTGEVTAQSLVASSLEKIDSTKEYNAYVSVHKEQALEQAKEIDEAISQGKKVGALAGIPIAIKDNIVSKKGSTTCSSRMLENFQSPYNATVVAAIEAQGGIVIGKTNMDEFAMGSSTETSFYGKTLNPLDTSKIPGGSSGGSAVALASGSVPLSLGSDTGGSIRQPAACCGVVGLKPTYGRISRYGLVAFASSLDQIGPMARNVEDAAYLLNVIAGQDKMDQTSSEQPVDDYTASLGKGVQGKVIGVPKEYFGEGLSGDVQTQVQSMLQKLEQEGAKLQEVSLPNMEYGVSAYYIIATAEASSNLSRFDGVRYTHRAKSAQDLREVYTQSRSEGFGFEVKKRIMLGTHVLSSGFYDAYYMQAQKVRRLITEDFQKAFQSVDVILTPTMPASPVGLGDFESDPLSAYLADVYTVGGNLSGLPGISLPVDKRQTEQGNWPGSIQLIGKAFAEEELFQIARGVEALS
jgi:aspartyl-tRNA(Asn)/glutamyl-tRNA(Gln) amidotransferase subunit A